MEEDSIKQISERREAERLKRAGAIPIKNILDPDSCERAPENDEIKVPTSFYAPNIGLAGCGDSLQHFGDYVKASCSGYNYMVVKKADYQKAKEYVIKNLRHEYLIGRTAYLNSTGINLEKCKLPFFRTVLN
jgi:hypothetical protein